MNLMDDDFVEDGGQARGAEVFVDLSQILPLAEWVAQADASGVVASTVYDTLKSFRQRFGRSKVDELEKEVFALLKRTKRKPNRANADLERETRELFDRYR